jgi:hypothetical protein
VVERRHHIQVSSQNVLILRVNKIRKIRFGVTELGTIFLFVLSLRRAHNFLL